MKFKAVALITSIVTLVLGVGYILAGELIVGRWQIQVSEGVVLMGRRIGAVYLGLSAMFFLARSAEASVSRTAITLGTAIALLLLAFVGVSEFMAGHVGAGILASVAIEAVLAACFLWIYYADRRARVIAQK
jgi:hypothetical protein